MTTGAGGWGNPGVGSAIETSESELLWGADHARNGVLWKSANISGATRDAANSPTTILRAGLLMASLDASPELWKEWDGSLTAGTQNLKGVLDTELRAQDFNATNTDRVYRLIVARAPLRARKLLILGATLVGHAQEYLARRQLYASGHILDDDPQGWLAGQGARVSYETAATDTLTASQNGMTLFYMNAASVTVTLPAIQPGLEYWLTRTADEEFVVVSPTADNVIVGNDLSADGVTFTTGSEQIGATVHVRSVYYNSTLKWLMDLPSVPFGTGTATMAYSIQS